MDEIKRNLETCHIKFGNLREIYIFFKWLVPVFKLTHTRVQTILEYEIV